MKLKRGQNSDEPESWGSRFQTRRILIGFTQADIAKITGLTQQAVSRFENNEVQPRLESLEKYAHSVGSTVEEMFPMSLRPRGKSQAAKDAHYRRIDKRKKNGGRK